MKKLAKPLAIGLSVPLLGIILWAADLARFAGVFQETSFRFPGECSAVALGGSSADLQVDRERGVAYLSVLDRDSAGQAIGTVMLLDLNLAEPAPRAAMEYDPPKFRPQGLSLLRRPNEPMRLFVISRQADGSATVEIVEQTAGGAFIPKESVRNPAFDHPIAIAATGPRQFYLATDGGIAGGFPQTGDLMVRRSSATLLYFDGHAARIVARGLKYPAGLALSPDGAWIYVGEMLGKQLHIYRRDAAEGTLTPEATVPLRAAPAGLDVDADGVVWIAAHPKLFALMAHMRHANTLAPTQVLRFDPQGFKPDDDKSEPRLSSVYANDGTQISAGTSAAHWHNEFLVGALLDKKVLICKPKP